MRKRDPRLATKFQRLRPFSELNNTMGPLRILSIARIVERSKLAAINQKFAYAQTVSQLVVMDSLSLIGEREIMA